MTAADIVAYIGAAAWLPQIGTWIYGTFATPKLKIVSSPKVEIGFSTIGPVVNATFAFSSERRDALIERITLRITHERGEQRDLVWRLLNENQQQIRDAQGNISSQYKNNPAVALKVSTLALVEKTVGFHDPSFEEWERTTTGPTLAQFHHDAALVGNAAALDAFLQSIEFQRVQRTFGDFMYWRAGQWEFQFSAQVAGVKHPHVQRFVVALTEADITSLRSNVDILVPAVRTALSTDPAEQKAITWSWAYPVINPVDTK